MSMKLGTNLRREKTNSFSWRLWILANFPPAAWQSALEGSRNRTNVTFTEFVLNASFCKYFSLFSGTPKLINYLCILKFW